MNRILKFVGAMLVMAGITWLIAALGPFAGHVPSWSAVVGAAALVFGFVVLFRYGFRDQEHKWNTGEWVSATGVVARTPHLSSGTAYRYRRRLFVRLTCPEHGTWTAEALVTRVQEGSIGGRGTPVEALVRSNDKKVIEIVSMGGHPWEG